MSNNKNTLPFKSDTRGVSPVIGVILMVAITVILAAVIGVFVLGQSPGETAPTVETNIETPSSGDATIRLDSTSDTNKPVKVIANGATYGELKNAGDTVNVHSLTEGDTIRVVYYGDKTSHTVSQYEYGYTSSSSVSFTCDPSAGQYVVKKSATSSDCEYSSIQPAVNNASAGDTIQVYDGTYNENTLIVDKDLTIIGESQNGVEITASSPQTCSVGFPCNVEVTADGVTFTTLTIDNTGLDYGLISNGANNKLDTLTLSNANVGNAFILGSSGTITSSTSDADIQVSTDGTITDNTVQNGAVNAGGGSTVRNNDLSGGGVIYIIDSGTSGALVEDNNVQNAQSGIYVNRDGTTVRNNIVKNNSYIGVKITANNTVVEYNTIEDNNANGFGSAGIEIIQNATGQTIRNNELVNNGINLRFHAEDTEKYDAADTHTVTNNIIYGATEYDIEEVDDSAQTNTDVANVQQNYWGHNDGANTNADCTPASSRIIGDTDTSNPLCTAPTAGAS